MKTEVTNYELCCTRTRTVCNVLHLYLLFCYSYARCMQWNDDDDEFMFSLCVFLSLHSHSMYLYLFFFSDFIHLIGSYVQFIHYSTMLLLFFHRHYDIFTINNLCRTFLRLVKYFCEWRREIGCGVKFFWLSLVGISDVSIGDCVVLRRLKVIVKRLFIHSITQLTSCLVRRASVTLVWASSACR